MPRKPSIYGPANRNIGQLGNAYGDQCQEYVTKAKKSVVAELGVSYDLRLRIFHRVTVIATPNKDTERTNELTMKKTLSLVPERVFEHGIVRSVTANALGR